MMEVIARHFEDGRWVRLAVRGSTIESVEPAANGSTAPGGSDDWVAPAFWDIQTNGRWGHSFADGEVSVEQVAGIVRAQGYLGSSKICPTLITASLEAMHHGVRAIAQACGRFPEVAARVAGIHLEGPWISEVDGYRGAHPLSAVRDPDWETFQRLQESAGGRVVLVTLAPERPGAIDIIRKLVAHKVVVSLGHTAADGATLRAAADAGARLSTHLGNGIAAMLPRHPNPIWDQAALDELSASFIADGHHVGLSTLRVLVRAKGPAHTILVSDASPLAGLPPGHYGAWEIDPSGKVVVAGTPYLAGSNQDLDVGLRHLLQISGYALPQAIATVTRNPAQLLGQPAPTLEPGQPADFVLFRRLEPNLGGFELSKTCIAGRWAEPVSPAPKLVLES
jgi:N-acetylglucosamine-6-phosphate deacetylase